MKVETKIRKLAQECARETWAETRDSAPSRPQISDWKRFDREFDTRFAEELAKVFAESFAAEIALLKKEGGDED